MRTAREFPDKPAVVLGDESISYHDLDEVTSRLAATLIENGVGRGDRVGIYMNKSVASVVSIHGILKAGAAYVPLDPSAPPARVAYIVRDCGIKCLLASGRKLGALTKAFPESSPLDLVVAMDASEPPPDTSPFSILPWEQVAGRADASPPPNPSIETDLAYILYTSGSTGVPKGVMISHLNAMTFVNWAHETIGLTAEDRLSNHAPLHFDLSIFDIFGALKAGATLLPVPEWLSPFPIRLAEWIEERQISVWYSVPSVLSMMVLNGQMERFRFPKLRAIVFAGEVFPVKYLRQLMAQVPGAEYFNLYGPTETNVITCYQVPDIPPDQSKPIPIGKACENTEVFALDDRGEVVTQPGQIGELFARGSCVAQGYWGDPEKTQRSFVRNPIQPNFHDRTYKTGDLVTLDQEANYIFVGRRDHMVKSRGYRIELGEIETILYDHPDVKEAAVLAIPDDVVGNRIKAFVATNGEGRLSALELQNFCLKRIPRYMIPETVEFRETLPKTSTEKIDRHALAKEK